MGGDGSAFSRVTGHFVGARVNKGRANAAVVGSRMEMGVVEEKRGRSLGYVVAEGEA